MNLSSLKDFSIIVAGAIALVTFIFSSWQFRGQVRNSRVEHFVTMRRRFLEDPIFRGLLNMLTANDPAIAETPIQDRRNFVGFFEEVALMVNSGLVRPEIAHYMFGYYATLIDQNKLFWTGLDRDSDYWHVFRTFAEDMHARAKLPECKEPLRF